MPSAIEAALSSPWRDAALIESAVSCPWRDAVLVESTGSAFTAGAPPSGGTTTAPSLDALYVLPAAAGYAVSHTLTVVDLTDGVALELTDLSIATDDGSVCWTLNANGPPELFARVTAAGQPPVWEVTLDGILWRFLIESARRTRGEFGIGGVSVTGRSVTMLAAEPYQYPQNWVNEGDATAAQLVEQAQVYTGLGVSWQLVDWLVPDSVWSYSGSPLAVAQRVAESVGAVVQSDPAEPVIVIAARYRELPNVWPLTVPDVEIHADAIMTDGYERADRPAYTGVYVSGQQQGVTGLVRLEGTPGDILAPPVTDLLLTDADAVRQRGEAILGAGGQQARVQMTLPILTGAGLPGVLSVGQLCRVVEAGAATWWGLVRAVSVAVSLPSALQTVTLERHTAPIAGTVIQ